MYHLKDKKMGRENDGHESDILLPSDWRFREDLIWLLYECPNEA
jgi:hypothetical protein